MSNKQEDSIQKYSQSNTRRNFVRWTGQVVAGVSLASLGLELANPKNVSAAASMPNCTQCPAYGTVYKTVCGADSNCVNNGGYKVTKYIYIGGCVPAGQQCPTDVGCSKCVSSCPSSC